MADSTIIPLIPRKAFFENANAGSPELSPDGRWLAWIAAVDGVMNIWVAPCGDLTKAHPLTRQTDRPIFEHWFARTNAHVLFRKDKDGENGDPLYVGVALAAQNQLPEAVGHYRQALEQQPDNADAREALAAALRTLEQQDESRKQLPTAVRLPAN